MRMDDPIIQAWGNGFVDGLTYVANGGLALMYFLWERAPQLFAIAAALVLLVTFDRLAQQEAMYAPGRYGGATKPTQIPRTAQTVTLVALGLWLIATWTYQTLVPLLGAVMWSALPIVLTMMPQQRWTLQWTMKGYLILYALAVIGFRVMLWQAGQLSPAQLAELLGGAQSAGHVIAQNTGTLATIGTWLLWVILPVGYFSIFLQNMMAQPMSMVNPLSGAQDVITTLRTRGER